MPDHLTPERRSWNMSRIKGMNTSPEREVRRRVYSRGLRYRTNVMSLPGRPDMVFFAARLVVFIDGDFWHGWRFPAWSRRLGAYWKAKISRNRARDRRNFHKLRRSGWTVLRIWEHEVKADPDACVDRIARALGVPVQRSHEHLLLSHQGLALVGQGGVVGSKKGGVCIRGRISATGPSERGGAPG